MRLETARQLGCKGNFVSEDRRLIRVNCTRKGVLLGNRINSEGKGGEKPLGWVELRGGMEFPKGG